MLIRVLQAAALVQLGPQASSSSSRSKGRDRTRRAASPVVCGRVIRSTCQEVLQGDCLLLLSPKLGQQVKLLLARLLGVGVEQQLVTLMLLLQQRRSLGLVAVSVRGLGKELQEGRQQQ
jgi:hypothetical protein